jgi:predicted TIM-barrel fold metal-dependent hydrolase
MTVIDAHVAGESDKYPRQLSANDDMMWAYAYMDVEGKSFWGLEWGKTHIPGIETYLESMDDLGVDMLVLHSTANRPDSCRELNDRTARLCQDYPRRIVGLATVPLLYPQDAVLEVDRAINELGFKGLKIYPRAQKVTLDQQSIRPVLARAAELDVPVLTHCTPLPMAYTGYHGQYVSIDNTAGNLGRLFFSGVFSEIPDLKIIGAHLGAGMVFYKDFLLEVNPDWASYFDNIYYDLSGYPFSEKMIKAAIDIAGEDHLLFGSDYPLVGTEVVGQLIAKIRGFDLREEVKDKILGGNVARLLGIA